MHGYDISNVSAAGAQSEVKNSTLNQSNDQHSAARTSVSPTKIISKGLSKILEIKTGHTKEDVFERNKSNEKISANEGGVNHSSAESISEEVAKTLSDNSKKISDSKDTENDMKTDNLDIELPRMDSIQDAKGTIDTFKDKGSPNEDQKVTTAESFAGTNQDVYKEKSGKNVDKESDAIMRSEDENSKSGILEEVSFSSEESTFESVPPQGKNGRYNLLFSTFSLLAISGVASSISEGTYSYIHPVLNIHFLHNFSLTLPLLTVTLINLLLYSKKSESKAKDSVSVKILKMKKYSIGTKCCLQEDVKCSRR